MGKRGQKKLLSEKEIRKKLKRKLSTAYQFRRAYQSAVEKALHQCIIIRVEGIICNASSGLSMTNKRPRKNQPHVERRDRDRSRAYSRALSSVSQDVKQAKESKLKVKFGKSNPKAEKLVGLYLKDVKREQYSFKSKEKNSKPINLDEEVKLLENTFIEESCNSKPNDTLLDRIMDKVRKSEPSVLDQSLFERLTAPEEHERQDSCCSPCGHCPPCSRKRKKSQDSNLRKPFSEPDMRQDVSARGNSWNSSSTRRYSRFSDNSSSQMSSHFTSSNARTTSASFPVIQIQRSSIDVFEPSINAFKPSIDTFQPSVDKFKPDSGITEEEKRGVSRLWNIFEKKSSTENFSDNENENGSGVDPAEYTTGSPSQQVESKTKKFAGTLLSPTTTYTRKGSASSSQRTSVNSLSKREKLASPAAPRDNSNAMKTQQQQQKQKQQQQQAHTAARKDNNKGPTSSFGGVLEYDSEDPDAKIRRQREASTKVQSNSNKGNQPSSSTDKGKRLFPNQLELDDSKLELMQLKGRKRPDRNSHSNVCNDWSNPRFIIDDLSPPYNYSQEGSNIRILQYELWKAQEHVASLRRINSFLKEIKGEPTANTREQLQTQRIADCNVFHYFLTSFIAALIVGIFTGKFIL